MSCSSPQHPTIVRESVQLPTAHRPVLTVVVDTEEEFDWSRGFDRRATSVTAMQSIHKTQTICEEFGIVPTYVTDYPVASQPDGYLPLKELAESGKATIGAHLHPWVNPPLEEEVSVRNSFPGNLPRELEAEKLRQLVAKLQESFGRPPTIYKAGRYGIGPNSPAILEELDFDIDLSANPPFDFSAEGGPDFSAMSCDPYFFGEQRRLLGLPTTGAYTGLLYARGHSLFCAADRSLSRRFRLPSILSRAGLFDRLHLSPEGYRFRDLRRLTLSLLKRGGRCFVFSFHSPSVKVGCTPYVTSQRQLDDFLDRIRRYFDFFIGQLHGMSMTPLDLRDSLLQLTGDETR